MAHFDRISIYSMHTMWYNSLREEKVSAFQFCQFDHEIRIMHVFFIASSLLVVTQFTMVLKETVQLTEINQVSCNRLCNCSVIHVKSGKPFKVLIILLNNMNM